MCLTFTHYRSDFLSKSVNQLFNIGKANICIRGYTKTINYWKPLLANKNNELSMGYINFTR